MANPVADVVLPPYGIGPAGGQQPPDHAEEEYQHQRQPEFRHTAEYRAHLADDSVQPAVLPPGADDPQQQRQHKGQYEPRQAQQQRVADAGGDHVQHILLILVGDAEFSPQGPLQPAHILRRQRRVQPKALHGLLALCGRHLLGALAVVGHQRVARGQPGHGEHDDGQRQYAGQEYDQLLQQIGQPLFARHHIIAPSARSGRSRPASIPAG